VHKLTLDEGSRLTIPDVLHEIIDQSRRNADLPAVKDLDRELSYAELVDEAARLGTVLTGHGVVEGDRVVLLLPNSVDFVVTALACLWIGAAFVPLSINDPEARLAMIVADCAPALVMSSDARGGDPPPRASLVGTPLVSISALRDGAAVLATPIEALPRVAYVIYTSGTTGTPKGVQIGNVAFGAAVDATSNALGLDRATRTLCVSPFHFDGSFGTLFPTLFSGGAVVMRPRDALLFPRTFFNAVASEGITYTGFSPSYLRLLLANPQITKIGDSQLDVIALGGEASSVADIELLWASAPKIRVFNRYGPTEATIAVTHVLITPELIADGTVPVGQPHPGVSFHLVSSEGDIIEGSGQVGELYIGGVQLMDGYLGSPDLSDEVLRDDVVSGVTVYRTGDLVYRDDHGNYVYVDRADRVIKRSGVRISLIELSQTVRQLPGVAAATCVTFDDDGELGIVAFAVTNQAVSALELRRAANEQLPDNMMPNRIELVDVLPLTPSGKLDERLLLSEAGLRPPHLEGSTDAHSPSS